MNQRKVNGHDRYADVPSVGPTLELYFLAGQARAVRSDGEQNVTWVA